MIIIAIKVGDIGEIETIIIIIGMETMIVDIDINAITEAEDIIIIKI